MLGGGHLSNLERVLLLEYDPASEHVTSRAESVAAASFRSHPHWDNVFGVGSRTAATWRD
jgi:hypothetical protein